jgi:anti-sigma B factor antagonist
MPNDEYVVQPIGELDIANVPALRDTWLRMIDELQPALFVVDLNAVTYLDSSALGAIVALKNRQREHGGDIAVRHASRRLLKVFNLTGLTEVLHVSDGARPPSEYRDTAGPPDGLTVMGD